MTETTQTTLAQHIAASIKAREKRYVDVLSDALKLFQFLTYCGGLGADVHSEISCMESKIEDAIKGEEE